MSTKLKIALGILLIIAGFLLVRLGLFFKQSVKTATSANLNRQVAGVNIDDPANIDSDSDGIPDNLEAYYRTDPFNPDTDGDGFMDGEEVVSSYNPARKEGPSERNKQNTNATASLAQRMVVGLYTGDLVSNQVGENKYEKNVDLLALGTFDEVDVLLNPPPASDASLVVTNKSKQSQEEYLAKTASLLEGPFLSSFTQQPYVMNQAANFLGVGNYDKAKELFRNYYLAYSSAYSQLLSVPVPENWIDFHKHLLTIFQKLSINYLSLTKIEDDPLLALTALQDLPNNLLEIDYSLLQKLKILIQTENLEIPNSPLFSILDLLRTEQNQ
ncbi:MAG: hypothetical protein HYT65_02440 [Candidatus Yanofskybacteria bacterium]|nr:hypothetical protein [Candidatus Yanofskybacteria bacterium]